MINYKVILICLWDSIVAPSFRLICNLYDSRKCISIILTFINFINHGDYFLVFFNSIESIRGKTSLINFFWIFWSLLRIYLLKIIKFQILCIFLLNLYFYSFEIWVFIILLVFLFVICLIFLSLYNVILWDIFFYVIIGCYIIIIFYHFLLRC